MSLSIPPTHLSFSEILASPNEPFFLANLSRLTLRPPPRISTVIRMGGGPRTYPGGVSKWQWKRMQAKKAKQLLKARLCRERQIYEMRKRAELKAAVADLERPWEVVERAPNLFSVGADEQVKALADRFQLPGGFDLWTDRDGPQVFHTPDGISSARFFPKGVVHSVKPYGIIEGYGELESDSEKENGDDQVSEGGYGLDKDSGSTGNSKSSRGKLRRNKLSDGRIDFEYGRKGRRRRSLHSGLDEIDKGEKYVGAFTPRRAGSDNKINRTHTRADDRRRLHSGQNGIDKGEKYVGAFTPRREGIDNKTNRTHTRAVNGDDRRSLHSGQNGIDKVAKYVCAFTPRRDGSDNKINRTHTRAVNVDDRTNRTYERMNRRGSRYSKGDLRTEVYDMSLQGDGSYRFQSKNGKSDL